MKLRWLILSALAACLTLSAQEEQALVDDLLREGAQWAQENLDPALLSALGEMDEQKARQFLRALQQRLQGEHVVDLAALQETARVILPLLEGHSETRPYAAWLQSRMDYLAVAEQFRRTIPPPQTQPGQPPKPAPNPSPDLQRQTWQKQLEKRPVPPSAQPYLSRLKAAFSAQKVPPQLVWLAEVESSFDPSALSPAGAGGLFQLMPRTAQSLGLSLRPRDERLDPERSARAAATHLKHLYGQFKDWPLALAAYNAGAGTVGTLLARHKAKTFDQVARYLPAETQMYVPRIQATLFKREGLRLNRLPAPGA
jgi:membrane-bound lytic murein transglycosylase D